MSEDKFENFGEKNHNKRKASTIKLNLLILVIASVFVFVHFLFDEHPAFPLISTVLSFAYLASILFISWRWYLSLDEFEKQLLGKSALLALYAGILITMPWLVLKQNGFITYDLKAYILIFIMACVSSIYYYGKKFLGRQV